jgi:hypothetical protein
MDVAGEVGHVGGHEKGHEQGFFLFAHGASRFRRRRIGVRGKYTIPETIPNSAGILPGGRAIG